MKDEEKKLFKNIKKYLREAVDIAVPVLCLGIVVQLIIGDNLLGWDPIQNIQRAINSLGQNNFIGVAALLVLYSVFKKQ